jgi:hypothetical protein
MVVPKKAADVLFPYVDKGAKDKGKAKPKGKYPPDYELRYRARKGKVKGSYQDGTDPGLWDRLATVYGRMRGTEPIPPLDVEEPR